jgi:hypothetical protein
MKETAHKETFEVFGFSPRRVVRTSVIKSHFNANETKSALLLTLKASMIWCL